MHGLAGDELAGSVSRVERRDAVAAQIGDELVGGVVGIDGAQLRLHRTGVVELVLIVLRVHQAAHAGGAVGVDQARRDDRGLEACGTPRESRCWPPGRPPRSCRRGSRRRRPRSARRSSCAPSCLGWRGSGRERAAGGRSAQATASAAVGRMVILLAAPRARGRSNSSTDAEPRPRRIRRSRTADLSGSLRVEHLRAFDPRLQHLACTLSGSPPSTTKSASLPTSSDPMRESRSSIFAPLMVSASSAVLRVMPARTAERRRSAGRAGCR